MITEKDYFKNFKLMNENEKKEYIERFAKWDNESFPKLMALYDSWEKVPVKDFDEGLKLASTLMNARSFIGAAYQYSANRAIEKLNGFLRDIRELSGLSKLNGRPANDRTHYRAVVPEKGQPQEDGTLKRKEYKQEEVDGRRPEHLHEYIHLLPADLQRETEHFDEMYLALAEYRGRVEVLVEHPDSDKEMIAEFADKAIRQEQEIRKLWGKVDKAYKSAVNGGEPEPEIDYYQDEKKPGEYTREEIEAMEEGETKELCKRKRIEANKRYIRRADVEVTDEYKRQMSIRIRELMGWRERVSAKAREICDKHGIIIEGYNDRPADSSETEEEENNEEQETKVEEQETKPVCTETKDDKPETKSEEQETKPAKTETQQDLFGKEDAQ